jgi:hypothetical protein
VQKTTHTALYGVVEIKCNLVDRLWIGVLPTDLAFSPAYQQSLVSMASDPGVDPIAIRLLHRQFVASNLDIDHFVTN